MGEKRVCIFKNLKIKIEKTPHYGVLKKKSQIQVSNSSLIRINMFASEHLAY
jgi:hypothetical protein